MRNCSLTHREQQSIEHNHFSVYFIVLPLLTLIIGVCPVLCSSHGHYGGGICHCEEGWKGPECDVPAGECQVPGCTGHGRCIEGECHCERGWKGPFCDQGKS